MNWGVLSSEIQLEINVRHMLLFILPVLTEFQMQTEATAEQTDRVSFSAFWLITFSFGETYLYDLSATAL